MRAAAAGPSREPPRTACELTGVHGRIVVSAWPNDAARYVALLAHGYGEHAGRYDHLARALVDHGAVVYGPDHLGHGKSEGEPGLIEDMEDLVSDLRAVADGVGTAHPGLPAVLIGHSMGAVVATRHVQRNGAGIAALVLSGPIIGGNPAFAAPPLNRATLEALFAAIDTIAAGPSLGSLPTLWIHGEQDPLAPLEQTRTAMARIRGEHLDERIYAGAQHQILNASDNDEVVADVTAFVDRVLAGVRPEMEDRP
jgi:alpha-beta hydrolase superfamily lysophospholipase